MWSISLAVIPLLEYQVIGGCFVAQIMTRPPRAPPPNRNSAALGVVVRNTAAMRPYTEAYPSLDVPVTALKSSNTGRPQLIQDTGPPDPASGRNHSWCCQQHHLLGHIPQCRGRNI